MDAKHILGCVARLKQEMQELRESNALYRHRSDRTWDIRAYQVRRDRLNEIKAEFAGMLDRFKQTGTN